MKTTALALLWITLTSGIAAAPTADDPSASVAAVEISGTPEQVALAEEALAMFDSAGLELPTLTIGFHNHRSGCRGHNGVFRMVGEVGEVEICRPTRFLLLHELAHAWEAHTMDDTMRHRVMADWQLDNWNDHSQSANDRGAEKVADAVAFALDEPPHQPNETMRRNLCTYEATTGNPVPPEVELDCEAERMYLIAGRDQTSINR